jgi:hypothetical protein
MNEKYPYFVIPDIEALASGDVGDEKEQRRMRQRVALAIGTRHALERVLGDVGEEFDNFYPDMETPELSTNDTIDSFLDKFGNTSDKETDLLTRMIFTPTARSDNWFHDEPGLYEDVEEEDATASRIDAYLTAVDAGETIAYHASDNTGGDNTSDGNADNNVEKPVEKTIEKPADSAADNVVNNASNNASDNASNNASDNASDNASENVANKAVEKPVGSTSLRESLARVMIKNGNYTKALEIITELNLANPKKSVYFADQIRFLKKLIINQQKLKQ